MKYIQDRIHRDKLQHEVEDQAWTAGELNKVMRPYIDKCPVPAELLASFSSRKCAQVTER